MNQLQIPIRMENYLSSERLTVSRQSTSLTSATLYFVTCMWLRVFVTFLSKGHYKRAASRVMTRGSADLTLLQNTAIDLHPRCFYFYYLLSYLISDHSPVKLLKHQIKFWEPSISSPSEHRHPTTTYRVRVYEAWSLAAEKEHN